MFIIVWSDLVFGFIHGVSQSACSSLVRLQSPLHCKCLSASLHLFCFCSISFHFSSSQSPFDFVFSFLFNVSMFGLVRFDDTCYSLFSPVVDSGTLWSLKKTTPLPLSCLQACILLVICVLHFAPWLLIL
eukprot:m.186916 g.186916  ORF g.186916 m.186916 type:complete len:130 (-) comp14767_c0_seq1:169-558(-)